MDRGFNSYKLLRDLKKENIHYIVPLKKNSTLLPSFAKMAGTFEYGKKRMVAFSKRSKRPCGFLYLFEDPLLRGEEEGFLLGQVNKGALSMDEYRVERRMAGVFGIVSDLDVEAQEVFEKYKERGGVERVFVFL